MPFVSEAEQPGIQISVSNTTPGTVVAAANSGRQEITVTNDGTNIVRLRLGAAPAGGLTAADCGIRLNAAGGNWTSEKYRGIVTALAETGATNVLVAEL